MSPTKKKVNPGMPVYGTGLTLAMAKKMIEAGQAAAVKINCPMAISIMDSGGNLVAFNRMENTPLASIQICQDKAYTAVMGKIPTLFWKEQYDSGELIPLFFHKRWITFVGGFPLMKGNAILGAIGVSGGRIPEDTTVCQAALKAGGFSTEAADQILASAKSKKKR